MKQLESYIDGLIVKPADFKINQMKQVAASVTQLAGAMPDRIELFPEYLRQVQAKTEDVNRISMELSEDIVMQVVQKELDDELEDFLSEAANAFSQVDEKVDRAIEALIARNLQHNEHIHAQNAGDNQIFNLISQEHKVLLGYSEQITDLCAKYNITATDTNIDVSVLAPQQILQLYQKYIKYMRKIPKSVNPITLFREKVPDTTTQGIVLLVALVLAFTPILGIVSIGVFLVFCYQMSEAEDRAKNYGIIQALMYSVNPDDIPHYAVDTSLLLPTEITDEMMDNEPTINCYAEEYDALDVKYNEEEFRIGLANKLNTYSMRRGEIHEATQTKINEFNAIKQKAVQDMQELSENANAKFKELKDAYKPFEKKFSRNGTFNFEFVLGRKDFMEEKVNIGSKNIIIRPSNSEEQLNSFIRLLYVNAITHVSSVKLTTYVYDPNDFGRSMMMLYRNDLDDKFKILQKGLDDLLVELTKEAQTNLKNMKGLTIEQYNNECAESGRDSIPYKLLIILSQPKEFEKKEELQSLFEYSTQCGIIIWMVSPTFVSKNAHIFSTPFQGIPNPIKDQDNRDWCSQVVSDYVADIKANKPKGLNYTKFIDVACPPSKEWTFNADDNMYMYPGFQNGDPELCIGYPLGNGGNVHALGVGTTGAGKSVFLNHMIVTMCTMYSPRELQLWLCDFKGVEFQFYMKGPGRPEVLPHLKACLCTSDGDYATSLFNAVRNISDFRFSQMKDPNTPEMRARLEFDPGHEIPNTDSAKNWNRYWRKMAQDTSDDRYLLNCYPRLLLLCDEFQVIFQTASDKNLDQIKADMTQIAKLGRAANVHMFFTSQSMTGTLKGDVLNQFSLRFALRCTPDVSQDILGTSKSAELPQFGFLCVSATGIKKEDQPKFATPGIEKPDVTAKINELAERARKEKMPQYDLITYTESTKHDITELDDAYNMMREKDMLREDMCTFVFGQRMSYTTNKLPDNTNLACKAAENMCALFTDYTDYTQFFNIIMANARNNKVQPTIVINSQVEDLTYLTEAEKYITKPEQHGKLLSGTSISEMVAWLENLLKIKKERDNKKPVWVVLLGWDKGRGIGIEPDITVRNKFGNFMQQCGTQNIHIFLLNTSMAGMAQTIMAAINYKVAGKCTQDDSVACIGTRQAGLAYDMQTGWFFRWADSKVQRDKMYVSEVTREIAPPEMIID